jgi:hypothetical protein
MCKGKKNKIDHLPDVNQIKESFSHHCSGGDMFPPTLVPILSDSCWNNLSLRCFAKLLSKFSGSTGEFRTLLDETA